METKADLTKKLIVDCARQEFLAAGFQHASVRNIAAAAQITTGAIYRHFSSKQTLFAAATHEASSAFARTFSYLSDRSLDQARKGLSYSLDRGQANVDTLYHLIYQYFDQFYLLVTCDDGQPDGTFLQNLVATEERMTLLYIEYLRQHHHSTYEIDPVALHFFIKAYISALLEPIRQRISRDEAIFHAKNLSSFITIGWRGLEEQLKLP